MQRKWWFEYGNFVNPWQGQRCLQGDEPARTVTKHEVRVCLSKKGIDILTFFGHAILIAVRPAESSPPPVYHIYRKG